LADGECDRCKGQVGEVRGNNDYPVHALSVDPRSLV
jgi:hypothetical protein